MTQFPVACLTFLPLLTIGSLGVEDQAIVSILQRAEPALKHFIVLQRLPVKEKLNLVIVFGRSQPLDDVPSGGLWWSPADRLGLFLQDRADAGRVYPLAIKPGPSDDCFMRIERVTGQELVLACTGEKGATYDNQKFAFDIRTKALVKSFSYPPFSVSQILHGLEGPQFVMCDTQQLLLVDIGAGANNLRVVPHEQADITLSRIPMQESSVGDRVYRTPQLPADLTPAFGPGKRFRLANEKNQDGSDSQIVVEKAGAKEKLHPLPQSDQNTWRLARPDDIANGIPPDQAEINEEIGPHQLEGGCLWFGKTFYNGEGLTGVGGFGYFDAATRSYRLYSPPEIRRWSVSSILVEADFIWLALYHRGEYGNNPGGLLRLDRKTEQVRLFSVSTVINKIVRHTGALYMGAVDGILVLRDDQVQSYFIDLGTDGRYQIVAREGTGR